jgi:hypothetical protein
MAKEKFRELMPFIVASFVITCIQSVSFGQAPEWYSKIKQIRLLETNRSAVEKLFQPVEIIKTSRSVVGRIVDYRVQHASISVLYSHGKCAPNSEYGYDVAEDTVLEIEITLRKHVEISKFGFDLSKFEKSEVEDVIGLFIYSNEEDGQRFQGSSTKLSRIILSPSKEQEKLACERSGEP